MERMRTKDRKSASGQGKSLRVPMTGKSAGREASPKDPVLRPQRRKQAFSVFGGAVERTGDRDSAAALAEMLAPAPGLARALTHGFHSYAGRMHPFTARTAIARFSQPGQDVLDPFCGSGTTILVARRLGRSYLGIDCAEKYVAMARQRVSAVQASFF